MNRLDVSSDEVDSLIGQVVDDYLQRLAQGEQPAIEQYAADHPEIAGLIRQTLPALGVVNDSPTEQDRGDGFDLSANRRLGDFRLIQELGSGGMGLVYEAEQISMGRRVALKILPLVGGLQQTQLQRFRNEVRAAAMLNHPNIVTVYSVGENRGVHYYTMQLIRGPSLAELIRDLRRLRADDQVMPASSFAPAAKMDELPSSNESGESPPGHDKTSGCDSTEVSGRAGQCDTEIEPPSSWFTRNSGSDEFFRSVAELGRDAAKALQHAHDQGVLHRDIKPGNILLDSDARLHLADFGLARIETDVGMTMTGDIVGTLRYMSPEQALGRRGIVDHRSDIYSLGATLYELLCLRPALISTDRQELLRQIAFEEPVPLRRIRRSIPKDLETIVMKAMSKTIDDRYQSAEDMADDFGAFLVGKPIKSKPPSTLQLATRWAARHVQWIAVGTFLLLTASLGLAIHNQRLTVLLGDVQDERDRADQKSREAETLRAVAQTNQWKAEDAARRARTTAYLSDMKLILQAIDESRLIDARKLLIRHIPETGQADVRGAEWFLARHKVDAALRVLGHHAGGATELAVFPDGKTIASVGIDGHVRFWDVALPADGEADRATVPAAIRVQDKPIHAIAVSPDGKTLACGTRDAEFHYVTMFDVESDQRLKSFHRQNTTIEAIRFSKDGRFLASGARNSGLHLSDLEAQTHKVISFEDTTHLGNHDLEFLGDGGDVLMQPDHLKCFGICSFESGRLERVIPMPLGGQKNFAVWPDGSLLAYARQLSKLQVVDMRSGRELCSASAEGVVTSMAVSPDGRILLTGNETGWVTIWLVHVTGNSQGEAIESAELSLDSRRKIHAGAVTSIRFTGERQFASTSLDGSVVTSPTNIASAAQAFEERMDFPVKPSHVSQTGDGNNIVFGVNPLPITNDRQPAVAMNGDGDSIIVWNSDDGSYEGVYAQRFDSVGNPVGHSFLVNTCVRARQFCPAVAMDQAGNFVVTWQSHLQDGSRFGIYGQRYRATGRKNGSEFRINTKTLGDQVRPSAAMNASGEFVVAWSTLSAETLGVSAQRYDARGVKVGDELIVTSGVSANETQPLLNPSVDIDDNGNFVVAWAITQEQTGGNDHDIYCRQFLVSKGRLGPRLRVNDSRAGDQQHASVSVDPSGDFMIAWSSHDSAGQVGGIHARRFDNSSHPLGDEFLISSQTNQNDSYPTIAHSPNHGFVTAWQRTGADGSVRQIYAKQEGNQTEFRVAPNKPLHAAYFYPSCGQRNVAMDGQGKFLVTWLSPDGGWKVFGQRYNVDGSPLGSVFTVSRPEFQIFATDQKDHLRSYRIEDRDGVRVTSLATASNRGVIGAVYESGAIKVWDLNNEGSASERMSVNVIDFDATAPEDQVALSSDGSRLFTAGEEGKLRVWDVPSESLIRAIDTTYETSGLAVSPDDKTVVSVHDSVQAFDVNSGDKILDLQGGSLCRCVCFHPDGNRLAVGHTDGSIRLWNLVTGQLSWSQSVRSGVVGLRFSPDGRTLFSCNVDGLLEVIHVDSGDRLGLIENLQIKSDFRGRKLVKASILIQENPLQLIAAIANPDDDYCEAFLIGPVQKDDVQKD